MSRNGKKESAELDVSGLPPLPQGWCFAAIEQLNPPGRTCAYGVLQPGEDLEHGIPFVRVCDVAEGRVAVTQLKRIDPAISERYKRTILRGGEVLLTIVGTIGRTAVAPESLKGANTARAVAVIPIREPINPHYVELALRDSRVRVRLTQAAHEVARKTLNLEDVRATHIPLAPLNEQRRIVARIEELFSDLDAGVAALRRAKANLKRYRAAVLKAAVEGRLTAEWRAEHPPTETASQLLDRIVEERRRRWEEGQLATYAKAGKKPPANWKAKYKEPAHPDVTKLPTLPQGWCWASLEQVNLAERPMSYGVLQPGEDLADGIPLVRVCDVAEGVVAVDQLKRISPAISERYGRTVLKGGEILLTIVGTIGRTAVAPECVRGANTARAVAVIAVSSLISPHYVEIVLREDGMRSRLTLAAHEVARKTLNLEDVRVACIPFAPLNEQSQIIAEVEGYLSVAQASESRIEAALKRSSRLRQSILKRAFEGKLVPQDPNDEPASVLLERLGSCCTCANHRASSRKRNA